MLGWKGEGRVGVKETNGIANSTMYLSETIFLRCLSNQFLGEPLVWLVTRRVFPAEFASNSNGEDGPLWKLVQDLSSPQPGGQQIPVQQAQ